jgi:hypothetical protein
VLSAGTAGAQIIGSVQAAPDTVTVGDPVLLTLRFSADPALRTGRIDWSLPSDTLAALDTLQTLKSADSNWSCRIRVALFAPGTFRVEPSSLLLFGPQGDSLQVAFAPESVHVATVLDSAAVAQGPAGYKQLIEPPGRIPWWLWLSAVLLAIGVAAAVWFWRRPKAAVLVPQAPRLPPWEVARTELDLLSSRGYHLRGEPRLFAIELSEIIRRYLEGRFGFEALEQTTSEIKYALRYLELDDRTKQELLDTLIGCDLAKYAKFHWPAPELTRALSSARTFVDATVPRQPAEAPAP